MSIAICRGEAKGIVKLWKFFPLLRPYLWSDGNTYNGWVTERLKERLAAGGSVNQTESSSWRLEIPAGPGGRYRLAQLDDYHDLPRRALLWRPPLRLSLKARASSEDIPGTWGFGLWNDPFGFAFLKGGGVRLPVAPNAAWFFFASPPNYLSLRDDLPAQGGLAATFRSRRWPDGLSLVGAAA
jgi:hypothetical protein